VARGAVARDVPGGWRRWFDPCVALGACQHIAVSKNFPDPGDFPMKRIFAVLVALFSLAVLADDTKTVESKTTVKKSAGKVIVEKKTTKDEGGMFKSTVDTDTRVSEVKINDAGSVVKSEHTMEHDAPGMKNDHQTTKKVEVVRDSSGNLIKQEAKVETK
jgi:hypothetical protein